LTVICQVDKICSAVGGGVYHDTALTSEESISQSVICSV